MIKICLNPVCAVEYATAYRDQQYCSAACANAARSAQGWSQERIKALIPLYLESPAKVVAHDMGLTKNQVIGAMYRAGVRKTPMRKTSSKSFDFDPTRCRWPFGDPKMSDFHYCGVGIDKNSLLRRRGYIDLPYCDEHLRKSWQ